MKEAEQSTEAMTEQESQPRVTVPELSSADDMLEAMGASIPETVEDVSGFAMEGFKPVEKPSSSDEKDADGELFDPEIHAKDKDGNPKKTAKGRWAKRPGRGGSKVAKSAKQAENAPESADDKARRICQMHALENASMTYMGGCMIFGEDGKPDFEHAVPNEHKNIVDAWEAFYWRQYVETGKLPERSPMVMIATATVTYAATRAANSKPAQTRLAKAKDFIMRRVAVPGINWWKDRKKPKKQVSIKAQSKTDEA
ncbi:MAG: hypothetical protein CBD02_04625 [Candidatus Pelagibacter sp. TMED142]|mgnify:CR=1 FL=1|nr:MAG: hypothetical protein CBD02_04625 [Candidatus Pelagibacter sp. TMED142]|tara:strand:+ start:967 stop:1731 length:765 start_codon:yes stop_codon:yes gene_type:complete